MLLLAYVYPDAKEYKELTIFYHSIIYHSFYHQ
jgi:hypothetical protein